jgi:GTP diphosphokinase / guanosine-3',5'-bis(diphosphate) 3'-diphosphatase
VYVFTPQGKIIALPKGATALDFAYAVHTDVGNTCFAVDVNEARVSLRTMLRTGDKITVHTSSTSQPRPDWLQFAKTAKARSKIRYYMRGLTDDAVKNLGQKLLGAALASLSITYDVLLPWHWKSILQTLQGSGQGQLQLQSYMIPSTNIINNNINNINNSLNFNNSNPLEAAKNWLFTEVGLGKRAPLLVAQVIAKVLYAHDETKSSLPKRLAIAGIQGLGLQYAACCLPIPGDAIVGKLGHDGRLMIHTHDCKAIYKSRDKDPEAWLDLSWGDTQQETFYTRVIATVKNGKGVLAKVAAAITDASCHISQVRTEDEPGDTAMMSFYIAVSDRVHLAAVYRSLRRVPYTLHVRRDGH